MKKFLISAVIVLAITQSDVLAMLDEEFNGDTLVIGGYKREHGPYNRLTVNISAGHINGSGWDTNFLQKSFTKGKYEHILYEHVGYSLLFCDKDAGFTRPSSLATIHFNLLKSGGTFDFLSYGYVFDDAPLGNHSFNVHELLKAHSLKCNEEDQDNLLQLDGDESTLNLTHRQGITEIKNDSGVTLSIAALRDAGFRNIHVQFEKDGVLGFTRTHGSLHISAKKPE